MVWMSIHAVRIRPALSGPVQWDLGGSGRRRGADPLVFFRCCRGIWDGSSCFFGHASRGRKSNHRSTQMSADLRF